MPTPAQIEQMRKVAFYVGATRYLHRHGDPVLLAKVAGDIPSMLALAAIGVPVASYMVGRHVGRFAGNIYGNASTPSPVSLSGREYDLASAATQRLIDEVNADRVNKTITDTMEEPEANPAVPKKPKPAFTTPSLLRYGR